MPARRPAPGRVRPAGSVLGLSALLLASLMHGGEIQFRHRAVIAILPGANAVVTADLDGDHDMDVVGSSLASESLMAPKLVWYENDDASPPGFTARVVSPDFHPVQAVSAADLDHDGDVDMIAALILPGDGALVWFENDGRVVPAFTMHIVDTGSRVAVSLAANDLNGDGDVDVLVLPGGSNTVKWYENDGARPPAFTIHAIGTDQTRSSGSISAADLDRDGNLDVLTGWTFQTRTDPIFFHSELVWYERQPGSPPSFVEHVVLTTTGDTLSVVVASDLDSDGDADFLASWCVGDKIAWYENDGASPPSFSERVLSADPDGEFGHRDGFANCPSDITGVDLDADGDTDIVFASAAGDLIALFENRGGSPPNFKRHVVTGQVDAPARIHPADLDGDGDPDLISASLFGGEIAWYENALVK